VIAEKLASKTSPARLATEPRLSSALELMAPRRKYSKLVSWLGSSDALGVDLPALLGELLGLLLHALFERGVLYAPDFMINAGGLINVYNELGGAYNRDRALRMTRTIYLNLMRAFEVSKVEGVPTNRAADRVAEERIETISSLGERHWGRFISSQAPDAAR